MLGVRNGHSTANGPGTTAAASPQSPTGGAGTSAGNATANGHGGPAMPSLSTRAYRQTSNGSLNINTNGHTRPVMAGGMLGPLPPRAMDLARSPPSRQNTSHVPCKFYKSGNCQAGQACPFSHDLTSGTENICKYFAKGNCKFGPKCANVHVLPNGLRVNYNRGSPIVAGVPANLSNGHLNLGGRVHPEPYHAQPSVLTNSLYHANQAASPYPNQYHMVQPDDYSPMSTQNPAINIPQIDTTYASIPNGGLGSPRMEDESSRFGLGLSPHAGGLSVLDAPLPASFDSNGISHYARMGPMASSVPAQFGIDTPPGSVPAKSSEALRNLHTSAFGPPLGSPRAAASPSSEDAFGKRTMHSNRLAPRPTKLMSSSLPKAVDQDWEAAFTFEEDYLPSTLTDLMTPQEKARRGSRAADDAANVLRSASGTPNNDATRFGSPGNASPSRWSAYFAQRAEQEDREREKEREKRGAFAHVGSPLRASLHPGAIPPRPSQPRAHTSGDMGPFLASPPRQSSMSIISQQLQRTRLGRAESNNSDPGLLATSVSTVRGGLSSPIGTGRDKLAAGLMVDRTLSSSSTSGRLTTPIEERDGEEGHSTEGDFVFSMDDEDGRNGQSGKDKERHKLDAKRSSTGSTSESNSASATGSWSNAYSKSPALGSIGDGRVRNASQNGVEGAA